MNHRYTERQTNSQTDRLFALYSIDVHTPSKPLVGLCWFDNEIVSIILTYYIKLIEQVHYFRMLIDKLAIGLFFC